MGKGRTQRKKKAGNRSDNTPVNKNNVTREITHLSRVTSGGETPQVLAGFPVSNPTASTKEVTYRITDYFDLTTELDIEPPRKGAQYVVDLDQLASIGPPAESTSATQKVVARLTKADFWVMPKFEATPTDQSLVLFSVPLSYGINSTTAGFIQSTFITSTSVQEWVHVGKYDANKLGDNLFPQMNTSNGGNEQALGTLSVVNPDTLTFYPTERKIQVRVVYEYTVSVPVAITLGFKSEQLLGDSPSLEEAWSKNFGISTDVGSNVLIQPVAVRNAN